MIPRNRNIADKTQTKFLLIRCPPNEMKF